jgi:hypothetical protein
MLIKKQTKHNTLFILIATIKNIVGTFMNLSIIAKGQLKKIIQS